MATVSPEMSLVVVTLLNVAVSPEMSLVVVALKVAVRPEMSLVVVEVLVIELPLCEDLLKRNLCSRRMHQNSGKMIIRHHI